MGYNKYDLPVYVKNYLSNVLEAVKDVPNIIEIDCFNMAVNFPHLHEGKTATLDMLSDSDINEEYPHIVLPDRYQMYEQTKEEELQMLLNCRRYTLESLEKNAERLRELGHTIK